MGIQVWAFGLYALNSTSFSKFFLILILERFPSNHTTELWSSALPHVKVSLNEILFPSGYMLRHIRSWKSRKSDILFFWKWFKHLVFKHSQIGLGLSWFSLLSMDCVQTTKLIKGVQITSEDGLSENVSDANWISSHLHWPLSKGNLMANSALKKQLWTAELCPESSYK